MIEGSEPPQDGSEPPVEGRAGTPPGEPCEDPATRHFGGRLPDWWAPKPKNLPGTDSDGVTDQVGPTKEPGVSLAKADETDEEEVKEETEEEENSEEDQPDDDPERDDDAQPANSRKWFTPQEDYWPKPSMPNLPVPTALSPGTKRLIYNVSAAGAGYAWGPTRMIGHWIELCGKETSIGGALVLGASICLLIAALWDRRTRHWYWLLAWVARIPLASAVTALALYAPGSQI